MTMKELRMELVETRAKIRSANEALKVLRARYNELKTRLAEAREARNAHGDG
jgi:uncharacterized coiled-coil DUF342 family protein